MGSVDSLRSVSSPGARTSADSELRIALPDRAQAYSQDAEWAVVFVDGEWREVRFHDYGAIYDIPGLYERLFYDILECRSPAVVAKMLRETLAAHRADPALRVLDLGAGNGIMGEELVKVGVDLVVGVDILEEAKAAAERDRPGVYFDYLAVDMFDLDPLVEEELRTHRFDCLSCVAALGFGDIPTECFRNAYNLVADGGWVAFTIKDDFLAEGDASGFGRLINRATDDRRLVLHEVQRYQHRLATTGDPLYYTAVVGRKNADLP